MAESVWQAWTGSFRAELTVLKISPYATATQDYIIPPPGFKLLCCITNAEDDAICCNDCKMTYNASVITTSASRFIVPLNLTNAYVSVHTV